MSKKVCFDLFTDGSSLIKGKKYEASSACLVSYDNNWLQEAGKYHIGGTNSVGEAVAVLIGLNLIDNMLEKLENIKRKNVHVRIFMDSSFVRDSLKKWVWSWHKQGKNAIWMNSSKKPVACQDVFKIIFYNYIKNADTFELSFYHLRGHVGEKISFKDAHKKFIKKNDCKITEEDFQKLVDGNHRVDEIAEKVRLEKLYRYDNIFNYYERGKSKCHLLELKDQKIRIKPRKRKSLKG